LKNESELSIKMLDNVNQQRANILNKSFKPIHLIFMFNNTSSMVNDIYTGEPIKEGVLSDTDITGKKVYNSISSDDYVK